MYCISCQSAALGYAPRHRPCTCQAPALPHLAGCPCAACAPAPARTRTRLAVGHANAGGTLVRQQTPGATVGLVRPMLPDAAYADAQERAELRYLRAAAAAGVRVH